ncbi:MAG: SDR family oxidoreductase [Clostridium sp.]
MPRAVPLPAAARIYGPLKSAINNLTNTFAGEYCPYNVRVTCIMPGFTLTPAVKQTISPEELSMNTQATLLREGSHAGRNRWTHRLPGQQRSKPT